jgi:hypothetical protein
MLLEQLQIVASKDDILVILDGRVFLVVDSARGIQCPKKGEDGRVHAEGRITVAKDILLDILLDQLDRAARAIIRDHVHMHMRVRKVGRRYQGASTLLVAW